MHGTPAGIREDSAGPGTYGVASHYLGQADSLPIVRVIGEVVSWVALGAWLVVFVAMTHLTNRLLIRPLRA